MLKPVFCSFSVFLCTAYGMNITVKVGVVIIQSTSEPFDLSRVGPVLSIAFERIREDFGLIFDPVYRHYSGNCPGEPPLGLFTELYYLENVEALIGPACSRGVQSCARLAQYLKLPMVTGLGDLVLRTYPTDMLKTLTKLSYNIRKISSSLIAMMSEYNWRHTAILYDVSYIEWRIIGENLVNDFRQAGSIERPYDVPFGADAIKNEMYTEFLIESKQRARVFVFVCNAETFREFMYAAYQLGYTNGEFVFITIEIFPNKRFGFYREFLRDDEKDYGVTKAYESVLVVTLTQPSKDDSKFIQFSDEVKRRALIQYNYTFGSEEEVNYFMTAFYDSALYLANVYNITYHRTSDFSDGVSIAQALWNDSFYGITGLVAIDQNGDRIADFDLLDMTSPTEKQFQIVGRFLGATQSYSVIREIVWAHGQPADKPKCGFSGEECFTPDGQSTLIMMISISACAFITILLIVVLLICRRIRVQQEIGRRAWIVKPDEIVKQKTHYGGVSSILSESVFSISTNTSIVMEQSFSVIGSCRGQTAAVRKLRLKNLCISKTVELEFHEMTKLNHSNLAKFVGACIQHNKVMLLMEYCPRGSLQDLLQNDGVELDWNIRYSLIYDIIKGMLYLHRSPVQVHGRLTSTNCVIDSRFMLKLTDYGLHSTFTKEREEEKLVGQSLNCKKLLWTAPEHLRTLKETSIVMHSQAGDVYSFGIILQEIITRADPFEYNNLTYSEIIKLLVESKENVLRPVVNNSDCQPGLLSLMKQCWSEKIPDRPSFTIVGRRFKQMTAGKSSNIMDNLLQRMSQYADNLESLAAERTSQYLEEKQRAEQLLHRLLPRYVANQLEQGEMVIPELFQCVSVYFSDIVGFTALAASSSHIEVVDFLNDLFTKFDEITAKFDVYKVETIGDAYMVVSGLPKRNGDRHIAEVSGMGLLMLDIVSKFIVRHAPDAKLQIRAGIHSGPVVAGVVGKTMPRYCLFGDTVKTASRMESTSLPLHIQMTEEAKVLLDSFSLFMTSERGEVNIKGKGKMKTFWLLGLLTNERARPMEMSNNEITLKSPIKSA